MTKAVTVTWNVKRDLPPTREDHILQFYETEAFLYDTVASFLARGFELGEPALVIASRTHAKELSPAFRAAGIDVAAAFRDGRLTIVDAHALLTSFMAGEMPDESAFRDRVSDLLERAGGTARLRVYGEMAEILWRSGQKEAALRLEELWDEIAEHHAFFLLCSHDLSSFYDDAHGLVDELCRRHGHLNPTG